MKPIISVLFLLLGQLSLAQKEILDPIMIDFQRGSGLPKNALKSNHTFDSTFIYSTDTIALPVKDDFSRDHFQSYPNDYANPDVTSILEYRLLDLSDVPLASDVSYTQQVTFRRVYDLNTATFTDTPFAPTNIKVGNQSTYPTVYSTTAVYPPFYIYDTIGAPDVSDTIWIVGPEIFQDSARQFFHHLVDPFTFWVDNDAFRNYRYAIKPWSLGVATFDGLDENGYPYAIGTTSSGYADYLTSKHIDLSTVLPVDSVYLSFLYQKKGFGDEPELGDSLIVEFFDKNTSTWKWQWSTNGGSSENFTFVHIRIDDPAFFNDGFRFRFKNYGGLSGSLDHFHIDYVHLRKFSGWQDTLVEDFALVYPVSNLLGTYSSVPWDHYQNNFGGKMNTNANVVVRNSYYKAGTPVSNSSNGSIDLYYAGMQEASHFLNGALLSAPDLDYAPRTTYSSFHNLDGSIQFDPGKPGVKQIFGVVGKATVPEGSNFLPNDSSYTEQKFENYYSYDDGTAEAAYGPTGTPGIQARLAIRYNPYEADSIIGVMMHFVPTVTDVSNELFYLTVWNDNGGKPGSVIYQDESFSPRTPEYGNERNQFVNYYFKDTMKVAVSGPFYVGWRQVDTKRLGVGFDMNFDNKTQNFYSIDNGTTWIQSSIAGSVMIRPIFSTAMDAEIGIPEITKDHYEFFVYPNPGHDIFNLICEDPNYSGFEVYDLSGKLIMKGLEKQIDLSSVRDGVYLVKLSHDPSRVIKLMKN